MQSKFLIGTLILGGALVGLISSSMRGAALQAIPVTDLRAKDATSQNYVGKRLRMVGFVGAQPLKKTSENSPEGAVSVSHFQVVEGKDAVMVSYTDALPDTFRKGGPVQVDGTYIAPGVMKADHVLTKCPSKYQEGEGKSEE